MRDSSMLRTGCATRTYNPARHRNGKRKQAEQRESDARLETVTIVGGKTGLRRDVH